MKKDNEYNSYKKVSVKDILIILVVFAAIATLGYVIVISKKQNDERKKELDDISNQVQNEQEGNYYIDENLEDLLINEVSHDGKIELYNSGTKAIDISGLEIRVSDVTKLIVDDNTSLDGKDYYVIETKAQFDTDNGKIINILNKSKKCVISMYIPKIDGEYSYARTTDASEKIAIVESSIGAENTSEERVKVDSLEFSVPGGFYSKSFELELLANEGEKIYYTIDGTTPTLLSAQYEKPIAIKNISGKGYMYSTLAASMNNSGYTPDSLNMGTVVKAIVVSIDGKVSDVYTQSYFVGVGFGNDYLDIPVIALTTDEKDLFDYYEGMYVLGRNYEDAIAAGVDASMAPNFLQGWVKNAHIEYFEADKNKTFDGNVEIEIEPDYSVGGVQKSFRIKAKDESAKKGSSLNAYLGNDKAEFILGTNKRDNNYKIRDYLACDLLKGLDAKQTGKYPCILFINGEYWGGYMLDEICNTDFIKREYNVDSDVIMFSNGVISTNGDYANAEKIVKEQFGELALLDMSKKANYEKAAKTFDIQGYLDYFCANMYLANADYGIDGVTMWRTVEENGDGYCDGKWRFVFGKMDNTMSNGTTGNLSTPTIDSFLMNGVRDDVLFWSFFKNEEFRNQFEATMQRLYENNFSITNVIATMEKVEKLTKKMSASNNKRFGTVNYDGYYTDELEKIELFFTYRAEYIFKYVSEVMESGSDIYKKFENDDNINNNEAYQNTNADNSSNDNKNSKDNAGKDSNAGDKIKK